MGRPTGKDASQETCQGFCLTRLPGSGVKTAAMQFSLRVLSTAVVTLFVCSLYAQNLVPNPSFEDVNCPTKYTGWPSAVENFAPPWFSANDASPDVISSCADTGRFETTVPANLFGYQTARTGDNYLAVGYYGSGIQFYDYISVELTEPLQKDSVYDVSFWLSHADSVSYASDNFGLYFSDTAYRCSGNCEQFVNTGKFNFTPHVRQTQGEFITNQWGWEQVYGQYIAAGDERYIIIGVFENWNTNQLQNLGPRKWGNRVVYYLDDVTVAKASASFPTTIKEVGEQDIQVYPNPTSEVLLVKGLPLGTEYRIYSIDGQELIVDLLDDFIEVKDLDAGTYIVQFENSKVQLFNVVR